MAFSRWRFQSLRRRLVNGVMRVRASLQDRADTNSGGLDSLSEEGTVHALTGRVRTRIRALLQNLSAAIAGLAARPLHRWQGLYHSWPFLNRRWPHVRRQIATAIGYVRSTVATKPWAKGGLAAAVTLVVIYYVDSKLGFYPGMRVLYLLPIWIGTRLSGPVVGLLGVIAVSVLMTDVEFTLAGTMPEKVLVIGAVVRFLSLLAMMLVIAQVERRLFAVETMATTDPLTGVLNRGELERRVAAALEARGRNGRAVSVALVDCDRFKEANDTNGHAFGDYVLRVLARKLISAAGHHGVVGRLGGDEFAVLFDGLDSGFAHARMEAAQATFQRHMTSLQCPVTMSFGLAEAAGSTDPADILRDADQRMYARKRLSRAVVHAHEEALARLAG